MAAPTSLEFSITQEGAHLSKGDIDVLWLFTFTTEEPMLPAFEEVDCDWAVNRDSSFIRSHKNEDPYNVVKHLITYTDEQLEERHREIATKVLHSYWPFPLHQDLGWNERVTEMHVWEEQQERLFETWNEGFFAYLQRRAEEREQKLSFTPDQHGLQYLDGECELRYAWFRELMNKLGLPLAYYPPKKNDKQAEEWPQLFESNIFDEVMEKLRVALMMEPTPLIKGDCDE